MRVGALWCVLYYYYTLKPQPMRKPIAALLAVMVLLLSNCTKPQKNDVTDTVHLQYYYMYNADADSTYIGYVATGTGIFGVIDFFTDSIFFNGQRIADGAPLPYGLVLPGFVSSGTFTYYNAARQVFTHSIGGLQQYTLPAGFTVLNRNTNDTIYWDGPAYNGTQNIKLTLKQGQQVNESFFNNSAPYIALDSTWMLQHLQPAFNSLTTQLEYIGGGGVGSGAPLGSSVDIRIQSPVKVVSVY